LFVDDAAERVERRRQRRSGRDQLEDAALTQKQGAVLGRMRSHCGAHSTPEAPLRVHQGKFRSEIHSRANGAGARGSLKWIAMSGDDRRDLEQRERLYRGLVDSSADPIALLDRGGAIVFVTASIERLTGFTPSELFGHSAFELLHPDDQ